MLPEPMLPEPMLPEPTLPLQTQLHHLLRDARARRPDADCLIEGDRRLSYAALGDQVDRLAASLLALGLRPGDRVAVHLGKSLEEAVSLLAISRAGGVFVNINALLKGPQVAHILADSGATLLICHRSRIKDLRPVLDGAATLRGVITVGAALRDPASALPARLSWRTFDAALEAPAFTGEPARIDHDPAGIIYTSGSTGLPKGVVVSHRNLLAGAESVSTYLRNTAADVILSVLPFSFDYGLNQLTCCLRVGAQLVLQRYLGPGDILAAFAAHPITGLAGIPPIWSALLQLDWDATHFASLRYITNSGGAFPVEQVRAYRQRAPHVAVFLMYGLTEAFRSTYLDPSEVDRRPDSMGKAIPNAEILVVDDAGRPCGPGEVGQLLHRGVHVSLGYWNDPDRTAERFKKNPLQLNGLQIEERVVFSGDYVKRDAEGFLYFVGRRDQMIKTRGFRVSPEEVEAAFYQTGLVQDVVAVGVPHAEHGQAIEVVCTLAAGVSADAAAITRAAGQSLPAYLTPQRLEIHPSLPRNANGKLDRSRIAAEVTAAAQARP